MSAWSRSLYLDLAQQLACGSIAVNEAAGGAAAFKSVTDYAGALATIACQLNAANNAQGATAVALDFSSIPGLTQTIACLTGSLAGTNVPYGSYDMYAQWNAIACNLNTVAVNTGGASPGGLQGGSIYAFMNAAICSMNQIAENGFAPPDPVQEFINAINAFSPDVLLVGDRGTSTTTPGQPVSPWLDQSGNGNNATGTGTARPTYLADVSNGRAGLLFDGTNDLMLGNFVNTTTELTDICVYLADPTGANDGRIATVGPTGVDEAGTPDGAISFRFPNNINQLNNFRASGTGATIATTPGTIHLASLLIKDSTVAVTLTEDATTTGGFSSSAPFNTGQYGIGASIAANSFFKGRIAFRAIWGAYKGAQIATILPIIKTYYGTP